MKSTGTRKDVKKGAAVAKRHLGKRCSLESLESVKTLRVTYGMKHLKGVVIIQPEEDKLIGLLDAGRVDEFRQRLHASRLKRRQQMVARVISGR